MTFTTGDTSPPLIGICQQVDSADCGRAAASAATPADLSGATVELHIDCGSTVVLVKPAVVTAAAEGEWSYDWAPNDLTIAGIYIVEAQVTYSDGSIQTFGPSQFRVKRQIG